MSLEDIGIIELYFRRDDSAISETSAKYGEYCYAVSFGILRVREDSEECVNDTWLRTWNVIPPERPSCLRLFLAKITRNLSLDRYRKRTAKKRGGGVETEYLDEILGELNECTGAGYSPESLASEYSGVEDEVLGSELREIINSFAASIGERERGVFLSRYFFGKSIGEIAAKYSTNEANVRKILFRTRKKLRDRLAEEGYSV